MNRGPLPSKAEGAPGHTYHHPPTLHHDASSGFNASEREKETKTTKTKTREKRENETNETYFFLGSGSVWMHCDQRQTINGAIADATTKYETNYVWWECSWRNAIYMYVRVNTSDASFWSTKNTNTRKNTNVTKKGEKSRRSFTRSVRAKALAELSSVRWWWWWWYRDVCQQVGS